MLSMFLCAFFLTSIFFFKVSVQDFSLFIGLSFYYGSLILYYFENTYVLWNTYVSEIHMYCEYYQKYIYIVDIFS